MRKQLATLLTVVFLVSLGLTANAAVKPGTSCQKLGQTSISSGKKYTCIKSGKKLVWNKGMLVSKPNSTPSPISSPTATSTPLPTPINSQSSTPISNEPKVGSECEYIGNRIPLNSGNYLECRMIANGKNSLIEIKENIASPINTTQLGNMKDCQVPDQTNRSINDKRSHPIGYMPDRIQSTVYPTEGSFKIVIIPIDFSDFPGTESDLMNLQGQANNIEKWFSYESNGKLKVSVSYVNKWLRAPKTSQLYNWNHPGSENSGTINPTNLSDDQIGQDYVNVADQYLDFNNVGAIFILHPYRIPTIDHGILANVNVNSSEGMFFPFIVANGFQNDRQDGAYWSYWIHQLGHHLGFEGHSPDELAHFDLMNDIAGFSFSTTTWNQLLVDWLLPSQLYCRTLNNLNSDEVTLTSIDSLSNGVKSAMIVMSSHEVLVIESRRKDYWSTATKTLVRMKKEVFDGFYGVEVYLVDTAKMNDPNISIDSPEYDPNVQYKYARNLVVSKNHVSEFKGVNGLQYLMLLGDSFIFRNVKISLISSGNFDTIKIEKI